MIITYEIKNKITNEYYIGVESNYSPNRSYLGSGINIKKAIKKYGKTAFEKLVTGVWRSKEIAFLVESWIVDYETIQDPLCYNIKQGGTGGSKKGHLKGIKKSKKHSMAIGNALRGRKRPKSVGAAVSKAKKGKPVSNLRGKGNGMYNKTGEQNPAYGKYWVINPINGETIFTKTPGAFYEKGWKKGSTQTKFIMLFDNNNQEIFFGTLTDLKNLSDYLPVTELIKSARNNGSKIYSTGKAPEAVKVKKYRDFYTKYQNYSAFFLKCDDKGKK